MGITSERQLSERYEFRKLRLSAAQAELGEALSRLYQAQGDVDAATNAVRREADTLVGIQRSDEELGVRISG